LLADVPETFNLVLANLPYLRPDQIDGNHSIAAEPRLALDGGQHGAEIIYRLIDQIAAMVPLSSAIMLEVDPSNAAPVEERLGVTIPSYEIEIVTDLGRSDRFVTGQVRI